MSLSRTLTLGGVAAALALIVSSTAPAQAAPGASTAAQDESFSFAVIGDVPYGTDQFARFPAMVSELNEQDDLRFVSHLGDIKAGSARCTDEYFAAIRAQFDRFEAPLVYTPGDNEWVDCHRTNNGSYDPLERLDALRSVFFSNPGKTLGANMPVSVPDAALPENVTFGVQRVAFSVLNVQGSNNSLLPWTGLGMTEPTTAQLQEVAARTAADVEQLERTFADAKATNARAVVVMTQADMFDPFLLAAGAAEHPELVSGFRPIVEALAQGSREFGGEVYLFNGDSHVYNDDAPLAAGSPWLEVYGQDSIDTLHRVTVEGAATSHEWLRVSVQSNSGPGEGVLSWERVPYAAS
ncbi:metallophosphoesterase family protein [Agromyces bauzanensis]